MWGFIILLSHLFLIFINVIIKTLERDKDIIRNLVLRKKQTKQKQ